MTQKIIILGTGGNCIDILDTLQEINDRQQSEIYRCVGFLDDDESTWRLDIAGVSVLGPLTRAANFGECSFVNGIGSVTNFWKKREIIDNIGIHHARFETIIHPTAAVSRMSQIGFGTVVLQNVTIASNVTIGNHVIILPNSIISHDVVIGDYTCITGGVCVSGNVEIGQSCYLGTNSSVIDNVQIGDQCLIGMGSVVLGQVAGNSVVAGNPARFLHNTL